MSRVPAAMTAFVLGIATLVSVGAAGPARADDSVCSTTTRLSVYDSSIVYGGYQSLTGRAAVATCTGGQPATSIGAGAGATYLERSVDGHTWQRVRTGSSADAVSWLGEGIVAATAWYRAHYTGGTESTTSHPDTFSGSYSAPVRISVIRALTVTDRSRGAVSIGRFRLSPTTGLVGKRLHVQQRKGGRWVRYTSVRVKAKGVFRVSFANSRRGKVYRLVVPSAGGLSGHRYGPFTATRR